MKKKVNVLAFAMSCAWISVGCADPVAQDDVPRMDEGGSIAAFFGTTYQTCRAETSYTIWGVTTHYSHTDSLTVHEPWGEWVGTSDLVLQIELGPWPVYLGVRVEGSSWSTNLTDASSAYTRTSAGSGSISPTVISGAFRVEAISGTTEEPSTYDVTFTASK